MYFYNELQQIRENGMTSKLMKSVFKQFEPRRIHMLRMLERYKTTESGVPIFTRYFDDGSKVNNKINNDFFSEIVDIKAGYFSGAPFSYQYDKTLPEFARANERMQKFVLQNNIADLDSETTKDAAICGYSARLLYVDEEGDERVMNVPPYEAIFFSETSISTPEYAMRFFIVPTERGDRLRVELYNDAEKRVFVEERKGQFIEDTEAAETHAFGICPLIGIPNNEELQGDVDKVVSLIDAYDRTLSDVNSEVESFRLAYMLFKGGVIDEETLRQAQRTGAFMVPDEGDIRYLTKDMSDTIVENHLSRIQENIYRFSKTPDLSDESFGGNRSGVSLKYKMFPLESKCKTFERKFNSSILYMFEGLCNVWRIKGESFDPVSFFVEFKRNFPLDLLPEAEVQQKLKGMVSEQTRLGLASFVDDPQYEMERMQQEIDESGLPPVDLDRDLNADMQRADPAGSSIPEAVGFTSE